MYGNFNHLVAAEQIHDMHRAAEQSRQAAELTRTRKPEPQAPRSYSTNHSWLGLRRRPKIA